MKKVDNRVFMAKASKKILIVPIPHFLKEPKCKCGKPADFMGENMTCICKECISEFFKGTKLTKTPDVSIPLTRVTVLRLKFEWSVTRDRWYTIYGRSLRPKNWQNFLDKVGDMMIKDTMVLLEANYTKETKEMVIF